MNISIYFIFLVAGIGIALPYIIRAFIQNNIKKNVQKKNYTKALETIEGKLYRILFGEYDQRKKQCVLLLEDNSKDSIESFIQQVSLSRISQKQKETIFHHMYFHYLDKEDGSMCSRLLDVLKTVVSAQDIENDEMMYRIIIEKKSEDINRVQDLLKETTDSQQKGFFQYLLGLQYWNNKQKKEARQYFTHAKRNMKDTPYYQKVKKYLQKGVQS